MTSAAVLIWLFDFVTRKMPMIIRTTPAIVKIVGVSCAGRARGIALFILSNDKAKPSMPRIVMR